MTVASEVKITLPFWLVRANKLPSRELEGVIVRETERGILFKGHAVARPTSHCLRCGRELTHPVSVLVGYGPDCSAYLGIYYPDHLEPHEIEVLKGQYRRLAVETWLPKSFVTHGSIETRRAIQTTRRPRAFVDAIKIGAQDYFSLRCSYDDRELAKSIPGRRWDPSLKAWLYHADLATVQQIEDAFGHAEFADGANRLIEELLRRAQIKMSSELTFNDVALPVKIPLYAHQKKAAMLALAHPSFAFFMEQGTGKTLAAIATMVKRYLDRQIRRVLVICPKTVIYNWQREIERFADCPVEVRALKKGDLRRRAEQLRLPWTKDKLHVVIINYESAWRDDIAADLLSFTKDEMVVLDESQRIKDPRTKQSKMVHMLEPKYRLILTGTPINKRPFDFFSQYLFLDPNIFGRSYFKFTRRYGIWAKRQLRGRSFWELQDYQNLDELINKAHTIAYRVRRDECLDLPPTTDTPISIDLEPEAMSVYEAILNGSELVKYQGEVYRVSASLAIVEGIRFAQITGGFLHTADGKYIAVSRAKLDALKEIMEDLMTDDDRKVVIFARFVNELYAIYHMITNLGISAGILYGDTKNPDALKEAFLDRDHPKVLVVQYRTGGVGLNLQRADTAIFYSKTYSRIDYEQARARVYRIGQQKKVQYIHLIARGTIDEDIEEVLRTGEDISKRTVDDWYEALKSLRVAAKIHNGEG